MHAQSPQAYTLSVLIHFGAVALVFVSGLVFRDGHLLEKQAKVFELVAGEGDNYMATEAPALGTPGGIKLDLPPVPVMKVPPAPVEEPLVQPAQEPVSPVQAVKAPAVKPPKPEPSFSQKIEKVAARREKKIVDKFRKEQAQLEKQRALEAKRLTKEEFDRLQGKKSATSPKATKGPRVDAEGIAKGVVGGSTANKTGGAGGKALSREEQDQLDTYFAYLKLKIQQNHEKPDNLSELLKVRVSFVCAANGAIGGIKIVQGSGSAEFDQSVIQAVRAVGSVGPRPDGRTDTVVLEIRMKDEE